MVKRRAKETLTQVKNRLTREQARRTETRIRQLLSPPQSEEGWAEDIEEETVEDIVGERIERQEERREVEARKSGLCARLLWFLCRVVLFGVCVVFCSVILLSSLSKVTIVFGQ
jgi:hypothetical protein